MINTQKSKKTQDSMELLLEELKQITHQLESSDISIDESINLCQIGNSLLKKCKDQLSKMKLKITVASNDINV